MKAMITKGGLYTWLNVRENKFIEEKFDETGSLDKEGLTEREQFIAQTLVGRGVLERKIKNKKTSYKLNTNKYAR
ncbi:MAG: hypothetical protein CMQ75_05055 [Gammaproteobacteria bacterium]|nr:hypothetical protein [Gammaproteobacteria bacterium]|tara:strand:+ start:5476 stop:5700 length:225 start_codon:yes stop_codon:yes gene_type:complete